MKAMIMITVMIQLGYISLLSSVKRKQTESTRNTAAILAKYVVIATTN